MDREEQLRRISHYEALLDEAIAGLESGGGPGLEACLKQLEEYYVSPLWKRDYADDEAGLLPPQLKRGVLSQDGIDGVLQAARDWRQGKMEKTKMVFFDLDGTLLPMDQDTFVRGYFGLLAKKCAPKYEAKPLVDAAWAGTAAMVKNNGGRSNYQAFWAKMEEIYGHGVLEDIPLFDEFYAKEFQQARAFCGFTPKAAGIIALCRELGFRTALATNPLFPAAATESRVRWAGLDPADFELITTYENSTACKPNPAYYREMLEKLGLAGEEVLMVGNDVGEDMTAAQLGMKVFLLTDCLINKDGASLDNWPHGDFDDLAGFLRQLAAGRH